MLWVLGLVIALPVLVPLVMVPVYGVVDPMSLPMIRRYFTGHPVDRIWMPIDAISLPAKASVMMSEDGQFCRHWGIDVGALRDEFRIWREGGEPRGASTITMQVARNLFLWNNRSFIRKGLEIPLALYIDLVLPKKRIMEIYLNIAQWGPVGEFGIEAGTQRALGKSAADLDWHEASLMAVALPNPRLRKPGSPSAQLLKVAQVVESRARLAGSRTDCLK
ncbi:peptidoglycan transglycosylase [Devosia sp. H5989]|nr:peptidoglycan transglycosylase [Devosia sp. H5989]